VTAVETDVLILASGLMTLTETWNLFNLAGQDSSVLMAVQPSLDAGLSVRNDQRIVVDRGDA